MSCQYIIEIPQDKYLIIQQIGSGTFSDIFSATHIKTNTTVALKILLKTNADEMLNHEVEINKSLHHPFICKFFTEFETEHLNIIVMELIDGITTLDYVNQTHGLPITEVCHLFAQLLIAIEYLHNEVHITHRDLKLENIMIDNCGHIRLIDFGFSTNKSMMSTLCGSIPYCAPEVLSGQLYTKESDIWSMGIILYALYDGQLPFFSSNTNTLATIICNSDVKFKPGFDESLKDLLSKMLIKDPVNRITIDEIKHHRFLSQDRLLQIDYKKLFSPTRNIIHTSLTSQDLFPETLNFVKPSQQSSSFVISSSQIRKNGVFRLGANSMNLQQQMHEILHEKITLKTDDIDLSIKNRKDFAHNLTKLIEYELLMNLQHINSGLASCDDISLSSNLLSLSVNHLSSNQSGTSDNVIGQRHSHHFVLTNRFANLRNKSGETSHRRTNRSFCENNASKTNQQPSIETIGEKDHDHHSLLQQQQEQQQNLLILQQQQQNALLLQPQPRKRQQRHFSNDLITQPLLQNPQPQHQNESQLQHHSLYQNDPTSEYYQTNKPHIISSLGLQQQYLMKTSHKRNSFSQKLTPQIHLTTSPVTPHQKGNITDE